MMSAARRKSRNQATFALGPVPQIIARIPRPYPPLAEALGALVTIELYSIWESILSDTEFHEIRSSRPVSVSALEKLDALIFKQAETFGWRLALSPLVQMRFSEWDIQSDGPTLFDRYGKALSKSARLFQKRELPPIDDPDIYLLKHEIVSELRRFLRNLRSAFSKRRTSPSSDEIIDHFQKTILSESDPCIHLKTNMNSWVQFFRGNSISVKLLLHGKRTSPAALFDSWFAWCKGFEPETIRQRISELGQIVRNSRKS
jgi:hypothetical protein